MRTVLRVITTRYGIAGLLVLAVLSTVLLTRLVNGEVDFTGGMAGPPDNQAATAEADTGPDDGLHSDSKSPTETDPALPRGVGNPLPVATRFAKAWIDTDQSGKQWRAGMSKHATEQLMRRLAQADPRGVPATQLTGPAALTSAGSHGWAEVTVPADGGDLVLGLVRVKDESAKRPSGKVWRVDTIDWSRG